jgi:hypothetical protein
MNDNNASFRHQLTLDDRQLAERRLCRLFKSFSVDALDQRDRLIDPYLERAAGFWRPHTGANFAVLAGQEADADLETWFTALLGDALEDRALAVMTGRAAFLLCSGPERWADQLLCPIDELEPAFVEAIRDHVPASVPPSELGEMHHQPYAAWSPGDMVSRALPLDRSFFQGLAGFLRRDAA